MFPFIYLYLTYFTLSSDTSPICIICRPPRRHMAVMFLGYGRLPWGSNIPMWPWWTPPLADPLGWHGKSLLCQNSDEWPWSPWSGSIHICNFVYKANYLNEYIFNTHTQGDERERERQERYVLFKIIWMFTRPAVTARLQKLTTSCNACYEVNTVWRGFECRLSATVKQAPSTWNNYHV